MASFWYFITTSKRGSNHTLRTVTKMEQLAWQIAHLVAERQVRHPDIQTWCLSEGLSLDVVASVERKGVRASLEEIDAYSNALGYDLGINVVASERQERKIHATCKECGSLTKSHEQRHLLCYERCFDSGIGDLVTALYDIGIAISEAREGFADSRRGGQARLVFPKISDAQLFLGLCDRGSHEISERAGLRGKSSSGAWHSSVRWSVLPGEFRADGTVTVSFPHSDIRELVRLAANPPRIALDSLVNKNRETKWPSNTTTIERTL